MKKIKDKFLKKSSKFLKKRKEKSKNLFKNTTKKQPLFAKRNVLKIRFPKYNFLSFFKNNYILYVIIAIIVIIWFFVFFWPIFRVKNIEIFKEDDLTNMEIAYKSVENFRWKSIFDTDKIKIEKKIINYQENIEKVNINIVFPNTLNIKLKSYNEVFNTNINDKNFLVLLNGSLVPHKKIEKLKTIKIFSRLNNETFLDYKNFFPQEKLAKILDIIKTLEENIFSVNITDLMYFEQERELHIKLDNYTILIFSLEDNVEKQVKNLLIFNKEHKKINKKDIVYIDLRIENKIFFCLKEEENKCKQNLLDIYPDYKNQKNKE